MAESEIRPQGPAAAAPQDPAAGSQPAGAPSPVRQPQATQAPAGSHASQPQQQAQGRPCPKDCSKCSLQHQVYCSTKMTFDSFAVMNAIIQRLDRQQHTIDTLSERLNAIQSSEAEFAAPTPIQGDLFPAES